MTTDDRLNQISKQLEVLPVLAAEIGTLKIQNTEILAQLAKEPHSPSTLPTPVEVWSALKVDDPIEAYIETQGGWLSPRGFMTSFDRDEVIHRAWAGSAAPDARVLAFGLLKERRVWVKKLLTASSAADVAPYRAANIEPDLAYVLILLGVLDPEYPSGRLFGTGPKVADYTGMGLEAWFNQYMVIGGAPGIG